MKQFSNQDQNKIENLWSGQDQTNVENMTVRGSLDTVIRCIFVKYRIGAGVYRFKNNMLILADGMSEVWEKGDVELAQASLCPGGGFR